MDGRCRGGGGGGCVRIGEAEFMDDGIDDDDDDDVDINDDDDGHIT